MEQSKISRSEAINKIGLALASISVVPHFSSNENELKPSELSYVNVKSFGAIGDGKIDDTNSFQKAIDYAAEKRFSIFLPPGTYCISNTLEIKPFCSGIKGSGMGSTKYRKSKILFNGNGNCISIGLNANYSEISDLSIEGVNIQSDMAAIAFECTKLKFENILIAGFDIAIGKINKTTAFDLDFRGLELIGCNFGLKLINTNNVTISSSLISSCNVGVYIDGGANHVISMGTVIQTFGNNEGKYRGLETENALNLIVQNCFNFTCISNYFETGSHSTIGTNQKMAQIENVKGFTFSSNYCVSSASEKAEKSLFTFLNSNYAVKLDSNVFYRFPKKAVLIEGSEYSKEVKNVNKFSYVIENNFLGTEVLDLDKSFKIILCDKEENSLNDVIYKKNKANIEISGNRATISGTLLIESQTNYEEQVRIGLLPMNYNHKLFQEDIVFHCFINNELAFGILNYGKRFFGIHQGNKQLQVNEINGKKLDFNFTYSFHI